MTNSNPIAVIGAGAWGTALALHLHFNGQAVRLWSRNPEVVTSFQRSGRNEIYLPNAAPASGLDVTTDLDAAACETMILATPSHGLRDVLNALKHNLLAQKHVQGLTQNLPQILIVSKGLEVASRKFLTEVATEIFPNLPCAVLSGPSFASNLAAGEPTTVCIAASDISHAWRWADLLGVGCLRPYVVEDVVGVQLGGAIKNCLAIANGILSTTQMPPNSGLPFSLTDGRENARAALLTRGLAEAARLCRAVGGDPQTLMGLAGIGDLILTASSTQSRNTRLGQRLGQGEMLQDILKAEHTVAEGVNATFALCDLATDMGVSMPLFDALRGLLNGEIRPDQAVATLMSRAHKHERL